MKIEDRVEFVKSILSRGHIAEIISDDEMFDLLVSKKLNVKWGTDPTSKNIHLGRAIPILMLRDLQYLGHKITIIIGDFTAEIGDTSDKESERPAIDSETVKTNMETYIEQIGLLLDLENVEFRFNSKWWKEMSFSDFIKMTDLFSLAEFSARSNIAKRLDTGNRVSVREMIYPIMQGYDSVVVEADIEVGGLDQRFNFIAGRKIQKMYNKKPQSLIMTNLIEGLDGRKMSSSWGNTINLTDSPDEMFGKLMSMQDEMIIPYFIHLTRVSIEHVNNLSENMKKGIVNPRDVKMDLAKEIVSLVHNLDTANEAELSFKRIFQEKKDPTEIPSFAVNSNQIMDILVEIGFTKSKGEARRVITQGGVSIDGQKIKDIFQTVPEHCVIKKGKRHFANVSVVADQ